MSLCVFSITFAASATLIEETLITLAFNNFFYKAHIKILFVALNELPETILFMLGIL